MTRLSLGRVRRVIAAISLTVLVLTATLVSIAWVPSGAFAESTASTAPLQEPLGNDPSAITEEGSKTNTSGAIVLGVVVVVIAGGALILYLRNRQKPT